MSSLFYPDVRVVVRITSIYKLWVANPEPNTEPTKAFFVAQNVDLILPSQITYSSVH
jgi:hypothetical protein